MAYSWREWFAKSGRSVINTAAWRSNWEDDLIWSRKHLEYLRKIADGATANLVLLGPAGSGKSSFINTMFSAVSGRVKGGAAVRGNAESVTKDIKQYGAEIGNLNIWDTVGISTTDEIDQKVEELLLQGKVPSLGAASGTGDDIDAAVIVVDATALQTQVKNVKCSVTKVQEAFERKDIPYILILTKIDEVDEGLFKNLTNVFYNQKICQLVTMAEDSFGVSRNKIWPIMNYEKFRSNRDDIDILALSAMEMVLRYADDNMHRRRRQIVSGSPRFENVPRRTAIPFTCQRGTAGTDM